VNNKNFHQFQQNGYDYFAEINKNVATILLKPIKMSPYFFVFYKNYTYFATKKQ